MEIRKGSSVSVNGAPTEAQLEKINALAKAKLTREQVYVFSLRLCDDGIDRDFERFDTRSLPILAERFVGKTGIVDHRWSADAQVARIFATEVVKTDGLSFIKAWAYIRRGGAAEETIADIEAGIKKEVSVGCAMGKSICSVCGSEYGTCGHQKGEYYDGTMCHAILRDPVDAYEFSFVAVPAQRDAGVLKSFRSRSTLKELAEEFGAQEEYRAMCAMAELGSEYRKMLQTEVVRLCLALELGVEEPVLRAMTQKLGAQELGRIKVALSRRLEESMPVSTQLSMCGMKKETVESGYLV